MINSTLLLAGLKSTVLFLSTLCLFRIFELTILRVLSQWFEKFHRNFFKFLMKALLRGWFFLSFWTAAYLSIKIFPLTAGLNQIFNKGFIILGVLYLTWMIHRMISYQTESLIIDRKERRRNVTSLRFFNRLADIFIWIASGLIIVLVLGYDITVLLAGLWVGSVLFAIASQKILAELFSSFALYSDHVFEEGDFITIADDGSGGPSDTMGRIEKIGIRSTHIRSPEGESIVIPNQELVSRIIYNYSKKKDIRMSLLFGVSYETQHAQLEKIDIIVQEILENCKMVKCGHVYFEEFKPIGIIFRLIFDLKTADHDEMQRVRKQIALSLKKRLSEEEIKLVGC